LLCNEIRLGKGSRMSDIPTYDDFTDLYFPKMPRLNPKKFGTDMMLLSDDFYYNFHIGFRKGFDSHVSAIIWNCLSVLKDNHRRLLVDSFQNILPKSVSLEDYEIKRKWAVDREGEAFLDEIGHDKVSKFFQYGWDIFFRRLCGLTIIADKLNYYKGENFNSRIADDLKRHDKEYNIIINNLECASKIEKDYTGIIDFLYERN